MTALITLMSLLIVLGLGFTSRFRDVSFYLAAFYYYFAFGPVINHLLGQPIYIGTATWRIEQASLGFLLAIVAICLPGFLGLLPAPARLDRSSFITVTRPATPQMLACLIALTLFPAIQLLLNAPTILGASKTVKVAAVGSLHYSYLLLELFVVSTFFTAVSTRTTRLLYISNVSLYVAYCLLLSERDFIFLFASILIHNAVLFGGKLRFAVAGAIVGVVFATVVFQQRFDEGFTIAAALNQGSILFVDTTVMELVPQHAPFLSGQTYVHAVLGVLPGDVYPAGFSLTLWLVDQFAPGSDSTYGFSLSAEAYLNFGMVGIPGFFLILSLFHRWSFHRATASGVALAYSVFVTAFLFYALRNDAYALIKGSVYGLIFLTFLNVIPNRSMSAEHSERPLHRENRSKQGAW